MKVFEIASTRRIATYVLVGLALMAHPALADDFDRFRTPCDAQQFAVVNTAVAEANRIVTVAIGELPPVNSTIGSKFERWFGAQDAASHDKVKSILAGIPASLVFSQVWCPDRNMTLPNSGQGSYAWVPQGAVAELFLEENFFTVAPPTGTDSQSGTIVHEVAHLSTVATVVDSDVTGDGNPDYGIPDAEQLARTRPDLAQRTANNLEYFVEDLAYGIP